MTERPPAVRLAGITKRYPRVVANRGVSFEAAEGEVHAIVGENGAGKSTLMKLLYGVEHADEGSIEVFGRRLERHRPTEAIAAGVGMVFQHFMLVPTLTAAENVVLGMEPAIGGAAFDRARAERVVADLAARTGLAIDPRARVGDLSVGLQQRVEILKVLHRGARVVILDEPTAVLTPQEVDELIRVMRGLASEGRTVLLITHKMREVMAASDRITVMRRGEAVATLATKGTTAAEVAHLMVGREVESPVRPDAGTPGSSVLAARDLRLPPGLDGVSLDVRAGEIVGLAGVEGNGQSELIECFVGLRRPTSGSVSLAGRDITLEGTRARLDRGLAHLAADRHRHGVVLGFTVAENAVLGRHWRGEFSAPGWLKGAAIRGAAEAIVRECDVRPPDPSALMSALSGGNQQKVVVGRELARRGAAVIAAHPTRGLDIGAIAFVHRSLLAERARGAGVLLVSSELSELMALSDRVLVMRSGRIVGEVDPAQVDERALGAMMTGAA